MADTSPGSAEGIKGDLAKGFTEVTGYDEAANLGDSDILRKGDKVGPRDPCLDVQDPISQDWQRGDIKPLKSPYLPK